MARQEKKFNYIYKITCNVTNRFYIGMHSTDNLNDGYFGSGKRLWFSLNYHGKKNHIKEILEYCVTRQELSKREEEIVTNELINEELCMNLVKGGQGGGGCANLDKNKLLAFVTTGGKANAQKIKTDIAYKNRVSKIGSLNMTQGWKDNKMQKSKRFTGKQHLVETKKLMSEKKQGYGIGNKNTQYGTCWITKEGLNKKIKKEKLNDWVKNGWVKGRIILNK